MTARDRVLEGVEASRRAGWARAYAAERRLTDLLGLAGELHGLAAEVWPYSHNYSHPLTEVRRRIADVVGVDRVDEFADGHVRAANRVHPVPGSGRAWEELFFLSWDADERRPVRASCSESGPSRPTGLHWWAVEVLFP